MEKEIKKADLPMVDTGENPEVPFPRDMIDMEVTPLLPRTLLIAVSTLLTPQRLAPPGHF